MYSVIPQRKINLDVKNHIKTKLRSFLLKNSEDADLREKMVGKLIRNLQENFSQ